MGVRRENLGEHITRIHTDPVYQLKLNQQEMFALLAGLDAACFGTELSAEQQAHVMQLHMTLAGEMR